MYMYIKYQIYCKYLSQTWLKLFITLNLRVLFILKFNQKHFHSVLIHSTQSVLYIWKVDEKVANVRSTKKIFN